MHRNFLSGGAPDFISDAADIIIRSATHELSYSRAIKPLTYESLARVRLHEDEGWRLRELEGWGFRRGGGGGQHVGSGEVMRKVLQNVQGLLVRGGFYRGSEIAVLHTLKVSAAAAAASSPSSSYGTSSGTSSSAKPENSGGGGGEEGKWIPAKDPVSGRTYYWHSITKQSRWRIPQEDAHAASPASSPSSPPSLSSPANSAASSASAASVSRPGADTVSQLLHARARRQSSSGAQDSSHEPDDGAQPRGADSASAVLGTDQAVHGGVRAEGAGSGEEGDAGRGMTERERGSVLQRAAGEHMVQARVSLQDSILAITSTHFILVDRHCVLRADVRNVESLGAQDARAGGACGCLLA